MTAPYDERRVLEEYAMGVFLDPDATPEDREKAKQRLMRSAPEHAHDPRTVTMGFDPSILTNEECNEMLWIIGHAKRIAGVTKPTGVRAADEPTTREMLENALALAKVRWEQLVAECKAEGKEPPSPVYLFAPIPAPGTLADMAPERDLTVVPIGSRGKAIDVASRPAPERPSGAITLQGADSDVGTALASGPEEVKEIQSDTVASCNGDRKEGADDAL